MRRLKTVVISSLMVTALLVSTLVSGCGAKLSASDSVATIGDKKLNYGVYNIAIRMSQATYDSYRYLFGNDLWSQDIQGNGSILSDNVKDNALEQFHTMMVMDAHKDEYGVNITDEDIQKINASAKAFVEKNKDAINSYITTTEADVAEYLRLYTVYSRLMAAIKSKSGATVSTEEAAMRTVSYATINYANKTTDSGETVAMTEEEKSAAKAKAEEILAAAQEGGDFESLVKDAGYNVASTSYDSTGSGVAEEIKKAADVLEEDEYSAVVESENYLYIIKLDKEFDEKATESNKETLLEKKETEYFNSVIEPWKKEVEVKKNDSIWSKIEFNRQLSIVTESTASSTSASTSNQ